MYRGRPRRIPVIDGHLIPVVDKIGGKRMSHMAEADHADASDVDSGRLTSFRAGAGRVSVSDC
jgi:hypothetical protein